MRTTYTCVISRTGVRAGAPCLNYVAPVACGVERGLTAMNASRPALEISGGKKESILPVHALTCEK